MNPEENMADDARLSPRRPLLGRPRKISEVKSEERGQRSKHAVDYSPSKWGDPEVTSHSGRGVAVRRKTRKAKRLLVRADCRGAEGGIRASRTVEGGSDPATGMCHFSRSMPALWGLGEAG
ncbi:hypothetical protein EYF80_051595 [Liparis tanakae]|uniref:Uncharacterized protein n=1 Tax=Liparis tanakae TaxID=230148 RepID=A0A4Z2FBE2_9TELE|nr:hypothetical protein EYF80_051595 [Liparis tanakae]